MAIIAFTAFYLSGQVVCAEEVEELEFSVKSFVHGSEIDNIADFLITLSKPIIDDNQLFTGLPNDAIRVTPAVEGKARWMARNQIGFFLDSTLAPSVEYTFELSTKLNPTADYVLTGQREFTHSTAPFKVERAEIGFHYNKELKKAKAVGTVTFNYAVNIEGFDKFLSIITEKGTEIPYTFQPQNAITKTAIIEISDISRLLEGQYLQAQLKKGFKCAGTEIGLKETSVLPIVLGEIKEFRVDRENIYQRDGKQYIQLQFRSPVPLENFREHFSITPSLKYELFVPFDRALEIRGDFKCQTEYTLHIKRGLVSEDGSILKDTYIKRFAIPNLHPRLRFTEKNLFLPRKGPSNLKLATINVERVTFGIAKVSFFELPILIHNGELEIASRLNEEVITPFPLKEALADDQGGIFKVMVNANKHRAQMEQLIIVTDLGIVTKRTDDELSVWVNSLDSLEPISQATVQLIDRGNKETLLTGKTDAGGFLKFSLVADGIEQDVSLLTVSKGNDFSFLKLDGHRISTRGFNVSGAPFLTNGYEAFLYTDRGVYRPGETVNLVGIVRDKYSKAPVSLPIRVQILTPYESVFKEFQTQTDHEGACEVHIPLNAYGSTGSYDAKMWVDKKQIGNVSFQVEDFMPDRMKVTVETDKDSYLLSDEVNLEVEAVNLFGTPAVGRKVFAFYNLQSVRYVPPDKWRAFNFSDSTRTFEHERVTLGEVLTNSKGKATYQISFPEGLKPPSALSGSIQATVQEPGGRAVTNSVRISIHPYSHYVGIKRTQSGTVKRNEKITFDYISIDPEGNTAPGRTLKATISAISHSRRWRERSAPTVTELKSYTLKSGAEVANFSFTPTAYGVHKVEVEDIDSRAKVSTHFYVSEWGGVPWSLESPEKLEMTLDKTAYLPGEKAKLHIKAPFPGKVLLTIDQEKVLSHQTLMVKESAATVTIPVKNTYSPNVYLSAMLIRSTTSLNKHASARAFGIVPLKLDAEPHKVQVEIDAPKQTRPHREVEVKFRVRGGNKSKPYRVSIAAVDEGILQLTETQTPEPHAHFYQQRRLETSANEFYTSIMKSDHFPIKPIESLADLMNLISPVEQSGAAYAASMIRGYGNISSVIRVKPVSLWSGLTTTDANGHGNVRFKIPQFNGTLRIIAVAFSGADYGSGTDQIQVRDPVVLTPTFPRFLSGGDQIRVPVSIFNGTADTGDFKVKLQATGPVQLLAENSSMNHVVVAASDSLEKQIEIAAGKEGQLFFDVIAHDAVGIAAFNLSASGNGEDGQYAPVRLPLRSAAPPVTKTGQGIVREDEPADFIFPSNLRADTSEFMLTVSPLPTVRFASGLRYLVQYPHGCLEQTTSRVFTLLYLSDLAKIVEPALAEEGKIDEYVAAGIAKLEDMLLPEHHFAYWPGRSNVNNWSSIYASHFLVEARKAGYKVSDTVYNRMLEGLRRQAKRGGNINKPNAKSDRYSLSQAVYACYVLSAAGQPEKPVMHYLNNNRLSELNDYSQFQLAGAFALSGDMKMALSMLPESIDMDKKGRRDTGRNFDSPIRAQAIMLDVLIEVMGDHPAILELVESLTDAASKKQRWGTTQENAFAFLALGKYLKKQPQQKFTGTIMRNGAHLANFDSTGTQHIGSDWDGERIELKIKGKGTCYYYWEAFGISRDSYIEEYGHELQVSRRYLTADGTRVKNVFQQGELIIAEINVKALTSDLQNVVVIDMLPAGFEIENPRLVSRADAPWGKQQSFKPDYMDIRDDRLILYGTFRYQQEQKFYYPLRVVTQGAFTVPPISAEAMYDPSKSAVASSGTIQVVK